MKSALYRPVEIRRFSQRGFTLVEMLMIIVVLGIAAGSMSLLSVRSAELSANLLRQEQAMTLAQAMLEEVRQMPFTLCDPNDPAVFSAVNAAACGVVEGMGPEPAMGPIAGEQRLPPPAARRFDNVNDYNGFTAPVSNLRDAAGNLMAAMLPTLANCRVSVAIAATAVVNVALGDALRITVSVQCPDATGPVMVSEAVRIRYAPNRAEF